MERDDELAVMMKYASAGKPVNTRLFMSKYAFQKAIILGRKVRCPHCGQTHVWSKKDAILQASNHKSFGPVVDTQQNP